MPLTDFEVLAKTLWGEARGLGIPGMVRVAWVIKNRVLTDLHNDGKPDWWGEGWQGVCLAPGQFSCWLLGDPNRPKLETVTSADPSYLAALHVASGVMLGTLADPTHGATHYHTKERPKEAASWPPRWAATMTVVADDAGHVFYRDPAAGPVRS